MTPGQVAYMKFEELFADRPMQEWDKLHPRTRKNWEKLAEEVALEYLVQKDCHC